MSNDGWGDGYDVGQRGMLQAIATAEEMGALRERRRVIAIIRKMLDTWTKQPTFNLRKQLEELIDLILEGKQP
jgi:hypothetical protein